MINQMKMHFISIAIGAAPIALAGIDFTQSEWWLFASVFWVGLYLRDSAVKDQAV